MKYLSIYFAAVYDDAMVSTYLTIRNTMSEEIKISDVDIYNSATFYALGFLIGGIISNVVTKKISTKKMMIFFQSMMLVVTILFLFSTSVWLIFIIRFLQGFFISGSLVSMNILLKQNFSQTEFNRFLALSAIFNCAVEALIPIVNSFLSENYGFRASICLIIAMVAISMFAYFLQFTDSEEKAASYVDAIKSTFTSYRKIMQSYLIFMLLIVATTEGIIDVVMHLLEDMIKNISIDLPIKSILPISISLISIFASIFVNLVSMSEKDVEGKNSMFSWEYICSRDKSILLNIAYFLIGIIAIQALLTNVMDYRVMIFSIICISTSMYVMNYIASRTVYSIYHSPGCVVSSISLFESLVSTIMQFFAFMIIRFSDNRIIFCYLLFFVALILLFAKCFYFFTSKFSVISEENKKAILS